MSGSGKFENLLFLGGESSGKSTISKAVSNALKCSLVEEYGRTFYEQRPGKPYEFDDLTEIGRGHLINTISACAHERVTGGRYVVHDTSLLVTYFYSMEWFGKSTPWLKESAERTIRIYEHVFLCENDFPYVQDGSRQNPEFSKKQRDFYKFVLDAYGVPYIILTGSVENRLNTVMTTIEKRKNEDQTMVE